MLAELVWFVPDAVVLMLYPDIAGRTDHESDAYCPVVSRHTVFLASVFLLFVLSAGSLFLWTFGQKYLPAYPAFLLLLPGTFVFTVGKILGTIFLGRRRLWISNVAAAGICIINITANLLLIPRLGIMGAAIGSTLAYAAGTLFGLYYYKRISGTPLRNMLVLQKDELSYYRHLAQSWRRKKHFAGESADAKPGSI
jgi:O-antigen/teichoic acid export membrane protein